MDLKIYLQWILQQTPPSKRKTLNELKIVLFLSSLINYFYLCKNGIFKPYLDKEQLRIVTEDIGELKASPMVSDNPLDKAGSVYSRKAASERKIQIIAVQFEE